MTDTALPDLIGLQDWPGPHVPVILVPSADHIDAVQANYPRATVTALPTNSAAYAHPDAWCLWMQLFQADVTLWPVDAFSGAFMAAAVPVIASAGIRTLRLARRSADDYARHEGLDVLWRNLEPLRGIPAGERLTLQALKAENRAALAMVAVRNPESGDAPTAIRPAEPAPTPTRPAEEVNSEPAASLHVTVRHRAAQGKMAQ